MKSSRSTITRSAGWMVLALSACTAPPPAAKPQPTVGREFGTLAVLGDTQRTSRLEQLAGREQNDEARAAIVGHLANESVDFCVHLGDFVFDGSSEAEWSELDELFTPLRDAEIPILPVLGNHEYWGRPGVGIDRVAQRFPPVSAERRYYDLRYGELGLVVLDSNAAEFDAEDWRAQGEWFGATLDRFDADPGIRAVVVFLHHPPFTNSILLDGDAAVRRDWLPRFYDCRKGLLMVSGHAHALEHFVERGRHFVVAGGGGGPRAMLLDGESARHEDQIDGPSPRPFHYLLISATTRGLTLVVKGFDSAEEPLRTLDRVFIPMPPRRVDASRGLK